MRSSGYVFLGGWRSRKCGGCAKCCAIILIPIILVISSLIPYFKSSPASQKKVYLKTSPGSRINAGCECVESIYCLCCIHMEGFNSKVNVNNTVCLNITYNEQKEKFNLDRIKPDVKPEASFNTTISDMQQQLQIMTKQIQKNWPLIYKPTTKEN